MPRRPACRQSGFSLLEIVLAVGIVAVVATTAGVMVHALGVAEHSITQATSVHEQERLAWRLLESVAGRAELRVASPDTFAGSARMVRVPTWCPSAGGWLERCVAELRTDTLDGAFGIRVTAGSGVDLIAGLVTNRAPPVFRFIKLAGDDLEWTTSWSSASTLPHAIGIVTERDTLVLRIGERG